MATDAPEAAPDRGAPDVVRPRAAEVSVSPAWPFSTQRSLRLALAQLSGAALLVGGIQMACAASTTLPGTIWSRLLFVATGWVYIATGVLAWLRRPSNRLGFLIVGGGFALLAGGLDVVGPPVLAAISQVLATLCLAVLVHVLHAFPSGRLRSRASRLTVLAGYFVCLVLQMPLYLFTVQGKPYDLLTVADRPGLANAGFWLQSGAGSVVMLVTTVILADRLRRTEPARRRILAPLYGYGILAVLFIPLAPLVLNRWLGLSPEVVSGVQLIDFAGVPVAFTLSLLRGGFGRTAEIQELGAWLGTAEEGRSPLLAALTRALGDESLQLVFWLPDRGSYVDENGDPADLPTRSGRGSVEIGLGGRRIGAIGFDATLHADPELVRAAGRVVAIAVDHERMTAELRASQRALRQSRVRIVEAGDVARRRIARDLHDGLQVRLVLLAMQAQQVAKDLDTVAGSQDAVIALRVGIDAAAAELRDLVHAVMPAALIERGLCAATEDLVDHLPIPTRLEMTVAEHSLPPAVQHTAYFVVAEALTNALKHAQPSTLTVRLTRVDGHLQVEVADDGLGGAECGAGSGLRGLTDRVDTLGGRLDVYSPAGGGTRIIAELPCAL